MTEEEMINSNKARFIELASTITREGAIIDSLIKKLEGSDFFVAPASTQYHGSFKGGLCTHCLNVYDNLSNMVKVFGYSEKISNTSIIIVSLFHDLSKMNFYEEYFQNKKIYSESGSKKDELGKFEWKSVPAFKVKESQDRFLFGTHGQNSEYMISRFIPLSMEESVAIINHMGGKDNDTANASNLSEIFNRYTLAVLLHMADLKATYCDERLM